MTQYRYKWCRKIRHTAHAKDVGCFSTENSKHSRVTCCTKRTTSLLIHVHTRSTSSMHTENNGSRTSAIVDVIQKWEIRERNGVKCRKNVSKYSHACVQKRCKKTLARLASATSESRQRWRQWNCRHNKQRRTQVSTSLRCGRLLNSLNSVIRLYP